MSLVTVPQANPNDEITAESVNAGSNAIAAVVNGQLDDTNIASVSGTKVAAGTVPASALDTAANPETRFSETGIDFVASGIVWSGNSYGSTLLASMTAGVVYISGKRLTVSAVTSRAFTASKDTYVDVDNTGTISYTEVTNNAASPTLAANSLRVAIIVTGASSIASAGSVNQGEVGKVLPIASSSAYSVVDSLGNLICNRNPAYATIGYRQIVANFTSTTVSSDVDVAPLVTTVKVPSARNKVKITLTLGTYANGNTTFIVKIKEGSTVLQTLDGATLYSGSVTVFTDATAGSHTYKAAIIQTGAGTMTVRGAATSPSTFQVELA